MNQDGSVTLNQPIAFKAETRQLLDILIHSLVHRTGSLFT